MRDADRTDILVAGGGPAGCVAALALAQAGFTVALVTVPRRPAVVEGTRQIAPLTAMRDLDTRGWLKGVTSFNFHMHLPHYALTTDDTHSIHVLATQPIDLSKAHPFTDAGNREFNTFVWMPPSGTRAGDVLLADSTIFSTLFAGDESLEQFWKNIAAA